MKISKDGWFAIVLGLAIGALLIVLIDGCILTEFQQRIYDSNTGNLQEAIKFSHFQANVSTEKTGVDVNLPRGVSFKAEKVVVIADPNSADAEGRAIGNVLKGAIR